MQLLPLLIISTALGIGFFCLDLYRNRRRLLIKSNPSVDLSCLDAWAYLDGDDLQVGQAVNHASHVVGEASQCASDSIGHCVEVIAHTLSHQ